MPSFQACTAKLLLAEPSPWTYPLGSHIEARKAKQKLVLVVQLNVLLQRDKTPVMGTCPFSHQQTCLHRLEVPVQFEEYRAQRHIHVVLVTEPRFLEPNSELTWATRYHTVKVTLRLFVHKDCMLFVSYVCLDTLELELPCDAGT